MTRSLQTIVRWGIYAVALIPLVIFKEFLSPFHFGKVVVFRTLIEIIAICYLALILRDRSFLPQRSKLFWAVTIFTGAFGLTTLTSIYPYQSFIGTLERMGGWFTFFHFWMLFVIATSVLRKREEWLTLIKISVFASVLSIGYGFLQKTSASWVVGSGGRERIFGTLGNAALFAGYTLLNMFLALLLVLHEKKSMRFVYGAMVLLHVVAVAMTVVRGSILGVGASLFLLGILLVVYKETRKMGVALLGSLTVILMLWGILVANRSSDFVHNNSFLRRITDISAQTKTVQTRFWAWQAGIDGWNDSPKTIMLGWGPENFNIPFSKHFNPKFYSGPGSETLFDRAHNMFVEILVTMGVLGFAAYLGIFAVMFWMSWKLYRSSDGVDRIAGAIFMAGLVAYMIHNAFIFDTSANFIAFFIMAGLLQMVTQKSPVHARTSARSAEIPATFRTSIILIAILASSFAIYKTNILPARANYASTRAIIAGWANDHEAAVNYFQKALAYETFPAYELRHRYMQYLLENIAAIDANKKLNAPELLTSAIEEVKKNLQSPSDYLPYLYISRAYIVFGKSDPKSEFNNLALENSLKAKEISPTFVRTYYEIAQAYINKEDYPSAIAAFEEAARLNPDVAITWWYMGATMLEMKQYAAGMDSVNKALALGHQLSEQEWARLVDPLLILKKYEDLAQVLKKLIEFNPANPTYHSRLAAAYAELGKIPEAVAEAKEAARLNPAFEPDARAFVIRIGGSW